MRFLLCFLALLMGFSAYAVDGRVTKVRGNQVTMSLPKDHGIEKNSIYKLVDVDEEELELAVLQEGNRHYSLAIDLKAIEHKNERKEGINTISSETSTKALSLLAGISAPRVEYGLSLEINHSNGDEENLIGGFLEYNILPNFKNTRFIPGLGALLGGGFGKLSSVNVTLAKYAIYSFVKYFPGGGNACISPYLLYSSLTKDLEDLDISILTTGLSFGARLSLYF